MDIYIWASTFALILTGVYCATVRWFHMCHPYDKYRKYFYPSRKTITIFYLLVILQIPYLIHPHSEDAWLLERCFVVLFAPTFGSIALRSYFIGNLQQWFKKMYWLILIPCILLVFLIFHSIDGGNEIAQFSDIIIIASLICSTSIAISLIIVFNNITKKIRQISKEEYSNEDDFPVQLGFYTSNGSVVIWVLAVIAFLSNSQVITAIYNNIATISVISLLITILHPHRIKCAIIEDEMIRIIEENRTDKLQTIDEHTEEIKSDIPQSIKQSIEEKIRKIVIDGRLYLNPSFSKTELVTLIGTNRTYLSEVLKEKFGSFYSFINKLRIEYAVEYSKEHPTATNAEIASQSGFGSVRTYTRVRNMYDNGEL